MTTQMIQESLIQTTFIAAWDDATPYFFDNPQSISSLPAEFINVLSFDGSGQNFTLAPVKTRRFCTLIGEIRCPKNEGKGRAMVLAQKFQDIFENKQLGIMHLREANRSPVNAQGHYGINVVIPYFWEQNND